MCAWICSWLVSRDKLLRPALRSFASNPSQLLCSDRLCTFLKGERLRQDAFHHFKCITIIDTKPILSARPVEKGVCAGLNLLHQSRCHQSCWQARAPRLRDAGMRGVTPRCHKSTGCSTEKGKGILHSNYTDSAPDLRYVLLLILAHTLRCRGDVSNPKPPCQQLSKARTSPSAESYRRHDLGLSVSR